MNWFLDAQKWFRDHQKYIEAIYFNEVVSVPPGNEDIFHPELWKSFHWKWFLDSFWNSRIDEFEF